MEQPEREACGACAELVALDARVCPHCCTSALVDLRVVRPVADGRRRYQIARALAALGAPLPGFMQMQEVLNRRGMLARQLTRAQMYRALAVMDANQEAEAVTIEEPVPASTGTRKFWIAGAAALLGLGALGLWLRREEPRARSTTETFRATPSPLGAVSEAAAAPLQKARDLAPRVLTSTVSIHCTQSIGAGFFVSEEIVLTNAHVLCKGGEAAQVHLSDGRRLSGFSQQSDERIDIATLRVPGAGARPLELGDAGALSPGDPVVLIGSPGGMQFTVNDGIISKVPHTLLGIGYIQITASITPGSSGGPLLDGRGRVVGIVSLKSTQSQIAGLALPINYAFSGGGALLPPSAGPASEKFLALLEKVKSQDTEDFLAAGAQELRPLLVGAHRDAYRGVLVRIIKPARVVPPRFEEFQFIVWRGHGSVCHLKGAVRDWRVIEQVAPEVGFSAQVHSWLQRHGLGVTAYLGEAEIEFDTCPPEAKQVGNKLELVGGDGRADRLVLN